MILPISGFRLLCAATVYYASAGLYKPIFSTVKYKIDCHEQHFNKNGL
jgi:hypothetical protein